VHDSLVSKGYDLFAKTDVRFLEAAYKLLRQEFAYQPQVGSCALPTASQSLDPYVRPLPNPARMHSPTPPPFTRGL